MRRVRAVIEGRVHGVGFRWFAVQNAVRLNLKGWVRNNIDGSVEAVAEGEEPSMREFIAILKRGPSFADVTDISILEETPTGEFDSFDIIR